MKISNRKHEANKANSLLSTGPKTPAGKQKVSRNACKHGFTGNKIVVNDDEREHFQSLHDSLLLDHCPANTTEQLVFSQILYAAWNLERVRLQEGQLLLAGLDALADPGAAHQLNLLNRYSVRFERSFHRNISELRKLQTTRAINQNWAARTGETASLLMEVSKITKQSHRFDNEEHYNHVIAQNQPDYSSSKSIAEAEARCFSQEVAQISRQYRGNGGIEDDPDPNDYGPDMPKSIEEAREYFEKALKPAR